MRPYASTLIAVLALALAAAPSWAAPLPASGTLDLADATGEQASSLRGGEKGATAGRSVAALGDFDGDGKGDLAIGEPQRRVGERDDGGTVRIVTAGSGPGGPLDAATKVRVDGAGANDRVGFDVHPAGDVNADGLADLLVGAPLAGSADDGADGGSRDGIAYLVLGRRGAAAIDLAAPDFGGARIVAPGLRAQLGFSVATAPDLDGDGRPELVLGAPRADGAGPDRRDAGAVFVVSGRVSGDVDLTTPGAALLRVDGPATNERVGALAGYAVDAVSDLDGDRRPELLVGSPRGLAGTTGRPRGAAYVVAARADGAVVDLEAPGTATLLRAPAAGDGATRPSSTEGDWFGGAVTAAGDVDGDGTRDVAVGAPLADAPSRDRAGIVRVVTGGVRSPGTGFTVTGLGQEDATGFALAPAGDVNADGVADVAVGAPGADPLSRTDAGAAYVVFGAKGEPKDLDLAEIGARGLRVAGREEGDALGFALAAAGDADADGGADLLLGGPALRLAAEGLSRRPTGAGGAALVFGAAGVRDLPAAAIKADPGFAEAVRDGCRPRTNVQFIVEDNDYTDSEADSARIRLRGIQGYVATPRNFGTVLGVSNDGSVAFEPQPLGADEDTRLRGVLAKEIAGDDSFPGYDTMFRRLANDNPAADARIMLVDGVSFRGVDEVEGLVEGAAPTYVVGIGNPPDRTKGDLRQMRAVAEGTRARVYVARTAERLARALQYIESRLRCDVEADRFDPELEPNEAEELDDVELDEDTHSADVTLNWGDGEDRFEIDEVDVIDDDGDVVRTIDDEDLADSYDDDPYDASADADADARAADADADARAAATTPARTTRPDEDGVAAARGKRFRALHVARLRPGGRLRVTVKAQGRKTRGEVAVRVTQSRRRR